jgi:hypothetical protein
MLKEESCAKHQEARRRRRKRGSRQIPLTQLCEQIPKADRQEIGRILALKIAAPIPPSHEKEESYEQ